MEIYGGEWIAVYRPFVAPTGSDSVELVYSEVRDLLRRQESKLDETRNRASAILAVIALTFSFLGNAILDSRQEPGTIFWVGIGLVTLGLLFALRVLWPRRDAWLFSPDPQVLQRDYLGLPTHTTQRHLAGYMSDWSDENELMINRIYRDFVWSAGLTAIGVLTLLLDLGGGF